MCFLLVFKWDLPLLLMMGRFVVYASVKMLWPDESGLGVGKGGHSNRAMLEQDL